MSSHSKPSFKNPVVRWVDSRLPVFSYMHAEYGTFPMPKNLNYWWNFGAIAMVMLVVMIATGLVMTGGKSPVTITEEKAAVAQGGWSKLVEEGDGGSDHEDGGLGDTVEEVHEVVANLMLLLALLHVAGVVAESRALGRNLARGMVTGQRR